MMTKNRINTLLAFLLVSAAPLLPGQTCDTGAPLSQKDVDSIVKQFEDKYAGAFDRGDTKTLAALYLENAINIGELGGTVQGRPNIENALVSAVKQKIKTTTTSSAAITNDLIITHGRVVKIEPAGAPAPAPKPWDAWNGFLYTHVLVRQGDGWRLAAVQHAVHPVMPKDPGR